MDELVLASQIVETTNTNGWKTIRKIVQENVDALNTLEGVDSLKVLEARRMARRALQSFLGDIDAIVNASHMSIDSKRPSEKSLYSSIKS